MIIEPWKRFKPSIIVIPDVETCVYPQTVKTVCCRVRSWALAQMLWTVMRSNLLSPAECWMKALCLISLVYVSVPWGWLALLRMKKGSLWVNTVIIILMLWVTLILMSYSTIFYMKIKLYSIYFLFLYLMACGYLQAFKPSHKLCQTKIG